MLRHVVLLRWVPGASAEQRRAVTDGLARLPRVVPEIRGYRFGADAGISPGNWDLAIVADFEDTEAYLRYAAHPAHRSVITEQIAPILSERTAVQHHWDALESDDTAQGG